MTLSRIVSATSGAAIALLSLSPLAAKPAFALEQHNVSKAVSLANDLGRVNRTQTQTLTIFLKKHNEAELDKAIEQLYNPESSTYHQWFTGKDFAKYAPSAAELETVKKELATHGLTVVSVDPHNFSLRVTGTTASAEEAFQTELHTFRYNGKTFQAHTRDAVLAGAAGQLVGSVVGLERHKVQPLVKVAQDPRTGKPLFKKRPVTNADAGSALLGEITATALSPASVHTYSTPGASLPLGIYYGSVYDNDPNKVISFTPAQLRTHYGLSPLVKAGYDGKGQTIALVEAYGYDDVEKDANVAAKAFGLPLLNSSNFSVIYPEGKPIYPGAADLLGWTTEIALDVQSAHAIAPGAKILVVASAGQDNEDQIASLQYIISHNLAHTVSSSWENDSELLAGPAEEEAFNSVLKVGAASGISFQFSSGDGGDQGLGTPVGALSLPSNSPYATAVGGTSILNNTAGSGQVVTGWGNNVTFLNIFGAIDPPNQGGFNGGAGGGESIYFPKPSWQKALPGTGRQVPDVSALADPFTGFGIIVTSDGVQSAEPGYGGTSLASPIFTAIWAIADQYNGAPLGQAAPAVSKLKAGQILDVLPTTPLNLSDVSGTVYDSNGPTFYSQTDLFSGLLYTQHGFVSAIWPLIPNKEDVAISFGTDSSLTVTPGWDNVTGFGEPNGLPFIQGVTGKTKGAALTK